MSENSPKQITVLPIEELHRHPGARPLNDAALAGLSESIHDVGLINPIRVRPVDVGYEVIAGHHRFAACDLLGWREIACIVVDDDDLRAELSMIDENLFRADLSPAERARQTARRKVIYEALHPGAKHGATLENPRVAKLATRETDEFPAPSFAAATAVATGQSERVVRRDAERGEKVIDEVLDLVRGTKLDTGVYLDHLKRRTPNDQYLAAKRDLAAERRKEREGLSVCGISGRYQAGATKPAPVAAGFDRFVKLADEIEALVIDDLITSAGRKRAVLGQRASGLVDRMNSIMERLGR